MVHNENMSRRTSAFHSSFNTISHPRDPNQMTLSRIDEAKIEDSFDIVADKVAQLRLHNPIYSFQHGRVDTEPHPKLERQEPPRKESNATLEYSRMSSRARSDKPTPRFVTPKGGHKRVVFCLDTEISPLGLHPESQAAAIVKQNSFTPSMTDSIENQIFANPS